MSVYRKQRLCMFLNNKPSASLLLDPAAPDLLVTPSKKNPAGAHVHCRGITGRLTMQIYPDLPEVPIF